MKITKIALQGFRAFDEPFELDLDGGKSLLLFGENGSGKSSIYIALRRFFEERGDDITKHRNHFSEAKRATQIHVHIRGKDAAGTNHNKNFQWDATGGHLLPVPSNGAGAPISQEQRSLLVDASRRAGFLDYRAMLRTHLQAYPLSRLKGAPNVHDKIYDAHHERFEEQLFDLVSLVVFAGVRVTVPGGGETTIGELVRGVWRERPASKHERHLSKGNQAANTFNAAFNAKLPELEEKLGEYLSHFEHHALSVKFQPVSLSWEKHSLALRGAELVPDITFRGKAVTDYRQILNEARLSAIATCMFLAGVHLSDNDYANPAYPRFLVLDDALIGLDLQNRLPILQILTCEDFRHYQIFLLTHDRVWYDLARAHLPPQSGWMHCQLIANEETGHLVPTLKASKDDIEIAKRHLADGDLKAAAVYARSAFEWKLRKVCEEHSVKVPFQPNPERLGAGALWDAIVQRQRERDQAKAHAVGVIDFLSPAMEGSVAIMRSTVLNKLSHAGASSLVQAEVGAAISTVEAVMSHNFPRWPA